MCIIEGVCEDPTEKGVWWRDDTEWCLYSAEHSALIKKGIAEKLQEIDLGTIVSDVHPLGARYTLNLRKMQQVAVISGQKRPVIVVEPPTIEPRQEILASAKYPGVPVAAQAFPKKFVKERPLGLHYKRDDGKLHRYPPSLEKALLRSMMCAANKLRSDSVTLCSARQELEKLEVGYKVQDCLHFQTSQSRDTKTVKAQSI